MDKTNRSFWAGPSIDYWIKRALEREQEAYLRGAGLSAKMFEEYQAAAISIRREINDFYTRYAGKYGLSYEQAVQLLNKAELQEWKASLGDYVTRIAKVQDPKTKALLTAELGALSFNSSITRLEALNGQINMILNDLYEKGVAQMKAEFGDGFTQSYYQKLYDIQARAGYITEIAKVTPRMIENIVSYPWLGAMFSDRLWQNKQVLLFHLREITTRGTIIGQSIAAMSQDISSKMGQSYKAAERLIRTETNHFHNSAEIAAYEAAGITEYGFMATLDSRTSETCSDLDGKIFKVKDAMPGTNFPPMHPNCRSTTIEHDPEEALDWAASGKEMPRNMTYKEWAEEQDIQTARKAQNMPPKEGGDIPSEPLAPAAHEVERKREPVYKSTNAYFGSVRYSGIERSFAGDIDSQLLDLANRYPIGAKSLSVRALKRDREFGFFRGGFAKRNDGTISWTNEIVLSNRALVSQAHSTELHARAAKYRGGLNMNQSALATVDHEYAHAIDQATVIKKNPFIKDLIAIYDGQNIKTLSKSDVEIMRELNHVLLYSEDRLSYKLKEALRGQYGLTETAFNAKIKEELGSYAASDVTEFLAEGFSAYRHIPADEQTQFLRDFGNLFDKFFDELF